MNQPKVSVIIPVYNAEQYLRQCLDSVVNQTLRDIEIICVDDGSTDGSLSILREYEAKDSRVKVLTQKNQFAGVARNHGMEAAGGSYYAFMDSDDYYAPDAIESMYDLCQRHELDFVKTCFFNVEPGKEPYSSKYSLNGYVDKGDFHRILSAANDITALNYIVDVPWNALYRASFLRENGIAFNHLRVINDHSFFVSCIVHARRAMVVEDQVVFHRVNQSSSLVGTKQKYYQCQVDNYYLVREIVQNTGWSQRRQLLQRDLDGVLHWYSTLYPGTEPFYQEQMDRQLRAFIAGFDENDVGIGHLLTMNHRELYYRVKAELLGEGVDPVYPCKVSFIVPVYNVERYLDECLASLCGQTLRDIEIICVDDKSTDGSLSILRGWAEKDPRVKVIAQEENTHQGGARNAGLDIARGKYVWFVDSDDYIDTDAAAVLTDRMEQLGDVDLLTFNADSFIEVNGEKKPASVGAITRKWPKDRKLRLPQDANAIPALIDGTCFTFFARRRFIDSYRFRPGIFFEDACFTFSALTAPGVFYELSYAPYHRRIREDSTTSQNVGLSEECLTDRIIALQDISAVIRDRNLPPDHFGVQWFKNWARYSIQQYWAGNLRHAQTDSRIALLQEEWNLLDTFSTQQLRQLKREPLIVSLTSYPPRIHTVHITVDTLLNQSFPADKVVLWLAEEEFPNREADLPKELLAQTARGLTIGWCNNIGPYKKLIPALRQYPDAIIVTADDDVYYHRQWLERLYRAYVHDPDCIHTHRVTKFYVDVNGEFAAVTGGRDCWDRPSYLNKLVGVGGVLYPPHCFPPEVLDEAKFMALAPSSDDIWFWLMAALRGYRVSRVADAIPTPNNVEGTQDCALWRINDHGENLFWVHFHNILQAYPQLSYRLRAAWREAAETDSAPAGQEALRRKLNWREQELRDIKGSASVRIGRVITWLPRKLRGLIQCYRDNGLGYTIRRCLYHLGLWEDEENPGHKKRPLLRRFADCYAQHGLRYTAWRVLVFLHLAKDTEKASIPGKDYAYYSTLPPEKYPEELKLWYKRVTGDELDLDNPKTCNEKLQWLKLYDATPLKTRLADKYLVRDWVKEKIGEEYLIPLLGVWDSFDEIDFDKLPNQFALKANHGSAWNIIVKDKATFDRAEAKKKFDTWMHQNFAFRWGMELHYMNIPPKIIAEQYMENLDQLIDYKVWCSDGKARFIWVDTDRFTAHKRTLFTLDWERLPITMGDHYPMDTRDIPKPVNLEKMIRFAELMCQDFCQVRVDFYEVDGKLYFGEMTFTSTSGTDRTNPRSFERELGDLITLPPKSPIPTPAQNNG
ncbi:MAG: glycosyltransferase [Oscillospiraceae bacterium]|nr:glycosyltransferase [Oscillospiraceae bacterium]